MRTRGYKREIDTEVVGGDGGGPPGRQRYRRVAELQQVGSRSLDRFALNVGLENVDAYRGGLGGIGRDRYRHDRAVSCWGTDGRGERAIDEDVAGLDPARDPTLAQAANVGCIGLGRCAGRRRRELE